MINRKITAECSRPSSSRTDNEDIDVVYICVDGDDTRFQDNLNIYLLVQMCSVPPNGVRSQLFRDTVELIYSNMRTSDL